MSRKLNFLVYSGEHEVTIMCLMSLKVIYIKDILTSNFYRGHKSKSGCTRVGKMTLKISKENPTRTSRNK